MKCVNRPPWERFIFIFNEESAACMAGRRPDWMGIGLRRMGTSRTDPFRTISFRSDDSRSSSIPSPLR